MRLGYDLRDKRGGYLKRHRVFESSSLNEGVSSPSPPFLTGSGSRSLVVQVCPEIYGIRASLIDNGLR